MKTALTIVYLLICVAIVILVMIQDTKSEGLGAALAGGTAGKSSYWSKNKGRSREGMMLMLTRVFSAVGLILVILLNMSRLR